MTSDVAIDLFIRGAFFLLLFIYTVHGIILAYHWFTYGAAYRTAMFAMGGYLLGGTLCVLLMLPALF